MRPHILLLTTGGTIASLPTAEGLAPGLDGEALAGLLPQGIMDCYDITIRISSTWTPPTSSRRSGRPSPATSLKTGWSTAAS
ncbi:MAG: hypothetical protein ACLRIS_20630 [Flavonifractor plautii]